MAATAPFPQNQIYQAPQNNQKKGLYAEFVDEKDHSESTIDPQTYMNLQQQNPPSGVYPQYGNPMVTPDPQFRQLGAEMIAPTVVYDQNILYKITSREPQIGHCTKCNKYVQTIVKYEVGVGTLISSGFLACMGALPCAWIPCVVKDLKDAVHFCPVCGDKMGTKKFIVN